MTRLKLRFPLSLHEYLIPINAAQSLNSYRLHLYALIARPVVTNAWPALFYLFLFFREFTSRHTINTTAPQRRTNDTSSFSRTSKFQVFSENSYRKVLAISVCTATSSTPLVHTREKHADRKSLFLSAVQSVPDAPPNANTDDQESTKQRRICWLWVMDNCFSDSWFFYHCLNFFWNLQIIWTLFHYNKIAKIKTHCLQYLSQSLSNKHFYTWSCSFFWFSHWLSNFHLNCCNNTTWILITGDFNIHTDNYSDLHSQQFLSLLNNANLTQHVNFPTHQAGRTLDLVITTRDSTLSPTITHSLVSPSDHFPIFTSIVISTPSPPPLTKHFFRCIKSINLINFIRDIRTSRLVTHPPTNLTDLVECYNLTL